MSNRTIEEIEMPMMHENVDEGPRNCCFLYIRYPRRLCEYPAFLVYLDAYPGEIIVLAAN